MPVGRTLIVGIAAAIIVAAALAGYLAWSGGTSRSPTETHTASPIKGTSTTLLSTVGAEENYIVITDFANRTVKVPRNVSRVVAIGPGTLRLLIYLNATSLIVGVEEIEKTRSPIGRDYAMAVHEVFKDLPVIGPGGPGRPPDPERILAVRPDLVIMSAGYAQLYDPDKLQQELGVPVVVVDYTPATSPDLSMFYRALRLLGEILNRRERAEQLINFTSSILEDLRRRVEGLNTSLLRVFVGAVSYRGAQPFTATQSPYPPLWWLSTRSIADYAAEQKGVRGFINLDFDYILAMQPDVVFIDENNLATVLQDFNRSPQIYCSIKAFREGRVYGLLPFNYYHTNIAVALADAYYIGKVLYPDRFADVDPAAKADEVFRAFLGVPLYQKFVEGGYPGFVSLAHLFRCG